MIDTEYVKERIAKGAGLLDVARPNWAHEVDRTTLDIYCPDGCVLGQLGHAEGVNYWTMKVQLGIEWSTVEYGFDAQDCMFRSGEYQRLTDAWREEIASRT